MPSQNIEWFDKCQIDELLSDLRGKYAEDTINLISYNPIGYVCELKAVSNFYDDNILMLASVICRSIIQGHPLQDGNKRFGMYLATFFLRLNNIYVRAANDEYIKVALDIARGEMDLEKIYEWFCDNTKFLRR